MEKRASVELLNNEHNSKNASSDSLNSDSKSSSLSSKIEQDLVNISSNCNYFQNKLINKFELLFKEYIWR